MKIAWWFSVLASMFVAVSTTTSHAATIYFSTSNTNPGTLSNPVVTTSPGAAVTLYI
jgi:hypothetical protein